MSELGTQQKPLWVAVIGSGPSGFYATEALLRSEYVVHIDMFERLPAPYGLVRNGVAPDHPKLKQPIDVYDKIAQSEEYRFFGNVMIGRDLSVDELRSSYHAVIFTNGAEAERKLGVPGEDLDGSHTATEFVGWYNGHPDYRDRTFDLTTQVAVIVGQGNVASDVGRILAKTVDELRHTDIAQHALDVLAESRIREIHIVGRRGPVQAKFTPKELREFGELADCDPVVNPEELELNPESAMELEDKKNVGSAKVYSLFRQFAESPRSSKHRQCHFTFLKSPAELVGDGRLQKVVFEKNRLDGEPFKQVARGTGEHVELEAGILFRSIGYRGVPIEGVPFDDARGVYPNLDGRILNGQEAVPQLYASGWIKRGPTGIIGTNRADSVATVQSLLADLPSLETVGNRQGGDALLPLLHERGVRVLSYADWKRIDAREIERGQPKGKPREKFTRISEMLAAAD